MLDAYIANLSPSNYLGPHQVLPLRPAIALVVSGLSLQFNCSMNQDYH